MAYYDFLNVVFSPLLKLPPTVAIATMAFIISLLIIIITKYTTNQALMKQLKDEIKEHQKQLKQLRSEPAKAMEIQKKAMEVNMKYMTHSLRPTLITLIPIFLIFGWMNSVFAYESIHPQQEFSVSAHFLENADGMAEITVPDGISIVGNKTAKIETRVTGLFFKNVDKVAEWKLKAAKENEYILEFSYGNEKQQKPVLITNTKKYDEAVKKTDGQIISIQINYKKSVVIPIGFRDWLGWLGTYIILSILFTMALRKLLKVY